MGTQIVLVKSWERALAKCLMLDVDGVLVDGRPGDGQRWDSALEEELGISSQFLATDFFAKHWNDVVTGKKDLVAALTESLAIAPVPFDAKELISYWFEMDSRIVQSVLADCLAAKDQGIPLYLVTNQEHHRAQYLVQDMGLGSLVDGIIYSAQAGCRKPQQAFYAFAAGVVGLPPHELLLVDDTLANIEGAHVAGWKAVHWDGSERLSDIVGRCIS